MRYVSVDVIQKHIDQTWKKIEDLDNAAEEFGLNNLPDEVDPNRIGYSSCRDILDAVVDILEDLLNEQVCLENVNQIVQEISFGDQKFIWIDGHYEEVKDVQ